MTEIPLFFLGAIFGSFLNVCIWRLPRGESIVRPASHCPACGHTLAWFENIPLVSYVVLRARCRGCRKEIPLRYFLVELVSGLAWLILWARLGWSPAFGAGLVFFSILIAVTATDLETGYIPDRLTLPGLAVGVVWSSLAPGLQHETVWYFGLFQSVLGVLAGGGILLLTGWIGDLLFRRETMGGGDIKLLGMAGAYLGAQKAVFIFFFAPLLALPFALFVKFAKKGDTIPYGPFLALTAAWFYLAGDSIIAFVF